MLIRNKPKELRAGGFKAIHSSLESQNVGFECANPLSELSKRKPHEGAHVLEVVEVVSEFSPEILDLAANSRVALCDLADVTAKGLSHHSI